MRCIFPACSKIKEFGQSIEYGKLGGLQTAETACCNVVK